MELHVELADGADEGVVAAQVHVELVVAREIPAAALAVHHVHHGDVADLHSTHRQASDLLHTADQALSAHASFLSALPESLLYTLHSESSCYVYKALLSSPY